MTWRRARGAANQLDEAGVVSVRTQLFRPGSITMVDRERVVAGRGDPPPWLRIGARAWGELVGEHGLRWREQAILAGLLAFVDDRDWHVRSATLESLGKVLDLGYRSLRAGLKVLADAELVRFQARRGRDCVLEVACGPALLFRRGKDDDSGDGRRHMPRRERRQMLREVERGDGPAGELARQLLRRYAVTEPASAMFLREIGELLTKTSSKRALERLVAMGGMAGAADIMAVLVTRVRRLARTVDSEAANEEERRAAADATVKADAARRTTQDDSYARDREQWQGEDQWLGGVLDNQLLADVVARAREGGPRRPAGVIAQTIRCAARLAVARAAAGVAPDEAVRAGLLTCIDQVGEDGGVDPPPLPTARHGPPGLTERLRSL